MSEAEPASPPRLRLLRTALVFLFAWPLVAGAATLFGSIFSSSPFNAGDFFSNPGEVFGFLALIYLFGAVPSAVNGMVLALISPVQRWMVPLVSMIWGALLFGAMGFLTVKSLDFFWLIGGIAGAVMGLSVLWKRRWFERTTPPAER